MSEHMAAEIAIGGRIPSSLVPELCAVLCQERVYLEWGAALFAPTSDAELIDACQDYQGRHVLWLCDSEANWGQFDDLEAFLLEHEISFDRSSEGKYEYAAELVQYRPGEDVLTRITTPQGEVVVPVSYLSICRTVLARAVRARSDLNCRRHVAVAIKHLEDQTYVHPPLEPFSIVRSTAE